ncbi:MAG: glycine/sarcosine/betaine reductase selenoprotein B family protein [Acidimicrobiia bacterium]
MGADHDMRATMATLPVPELDRVPFAVAPRLADASVAIVTTAGLHTAEDDRFGLLDPAFRVLPHGQSDLRMSHNSQNFDRSGIMLDRNVVYPVDRLDELATAGVIGRVSPNHFSFMGAQQDLSTILSDTGPQVAKLLRDQGTDVVLLTPV